MKKLALILLVVSTHYAQGQVNLVPNGSFEDVTECIDASNQVNFVENWSNPSIGTPDILTMDYCNNYPYSQNIGLPSSPFMGFQYPRTGRNCAGVAVFDTVADGTREYLQVKLLNTLKPNTVYCIEFYASLADNCSRYSVKSLGVHFMTDSVFVDSTNMGWYPIIYLENNINSNIYISDTINWVKISGSYLASGSENYLLIGNFSAKFQTERIFNYIIPNQQPAVYYYIDDVSVFECDSITGIEENLIDKINIYSNPAQGFVNVSLPQPTTQAHLSVYNLTGQLLVQQPITHNQPIPITELSNGMYIFVVQNGDRVLGRQRVVVAK